MIQAAKIIGTGKRPSLPYSKLKSYPKRNIIGSPMGPGGMMAGVIGTAVAFGPLAVLGVGFLVAFSFMQNGGGGGAVNPTNPSPVLAALIESLHHVNLSRYRLMFEFREGVQIVQTVGGVLNAQAATITANHPHLVMNLTTALAAVNQIVNQGVALPPVDLELQISNFENTIAPFDVLANELEVMIADLDPGHDFGSDTDSEDIDRAGRGAGRPSR